jgi:hypothetical protein
MKIHELDLIGSVGLQDLKTAFRDDDNVYSGSRATKNYVTILNKH